MSDVDAPSLKGRHALVTGAGRGIGRACALALADAGADVVLVARTEADLEQVASEVDARGTRATVLPRDITDGFDTADLDAFDTVPDVLVNSAGINMPGPLVELGRDQLEAIWRVNVTGTVLVTQAIVAGMLRDGVAGSIVSLSSQMGHVGYPGRTAYCASKHALEGFTKALAVELAPHGIRVNTVAPTFVDTPMTAPMFAADPAFRSEVLSRIPLGRLAEADEVARAVVYLAGDGAAMVTGSSIRIDGGWTAL